MSANTQGTEHLRGRRGRRGFALPMAILTLALITASIVAAYSSTSAEVVSNNAMRAQDHAYQLAEAGLQQFMLRRGDTGFCTNCVANPAVADSEWTRVSLTGGYADVVAMRVRPKLSTKEPALFFVRSTGVDTTVKVSGATSAVYARRVVGLYASFGTAAIKPLAAWTSLNGITNNARTLSLGNPGSGTDACAGASPIAGFAVPTGGQYRFTNIPFLNLITRHPTGTPTGVDSSMVQDTLERYAGIDWDAIKNYDAIPADVTIPPGSWPLSAAFNDTSYWPVIRHKGNTGMPYGGRGLLIVDGNLTLDVGDWWEGIILVGGQLIAGGPDTVTGAIVTGLNYTLPGVANPPAGSSADNDVVVWSLGQLVNRNFNYSSCKANRAAERLKVYFAWQNTWMDNVAIW